MPATQMSLPAVVIALSASAAAAKSFWQVVMKAFSAFTPASTIAPGSIAFLIIPAGPLTASSNPVIRLHSITTRQFALAAAGHLGDELAKAAIHKNLGNVYDRIGRYDDAVAQYDEAVENLQRCHAIVEKAGDLWVTANYLTSLGNVYRKLGQHAGAVDHHRQALTLIREIGDRGVECEILNNLGDARRATGEYEEAISCHRQALALIDDLNQRHEEAHAHEGIGHALHPVDPDGAREHWRRALEIYDRLGVPEAEKLRDHLAELDHVNH